MARKKVGEFEPRSIAGWMDGERHYNPAEMAAVMKAVAPALKYEAPPEGPSESGDYAVLYRALKNSLDYAGLTFELKRSSQERPTEDAVRKEFAKIKVAARRLLGALHTPQGRYDELPFTLQIPLRSGAVKLVKVRRELKGEKMPLLHRVPVEIEGIDLLRASLDGVQNIYALATVLAAQGDAKTSSHQVKHETDAAEDGFVKHLMWMWRAHLHRTDVTTKEFRLFAYAAMKVVVPKVKPQAIRGRVTRLLKTKDFQNFSTISTKQLKKILDL